MTAKCRVCWADAGHDLHRPPFGQTRPAGPAVFGDSAESHPYEPGACQLCGGDRWVGPWSESGLFTRLCVPCKFTLSGLDGFRREAGAARTAQDVTAALARALGLSR